MLHEPIPDGADGREAVPPSVEEMLTAWWRAPGNPAIIRHERSCSYAWLAASIDAARATLRSPRGVRGRVVSLESDLSPLATAWLLALAAEGAVVVPISRATGERAADLRRLAEVEVVVTDRESGFEAKPTGHRASHPLLRRLTGRGRPGLVLFSSGSTGASKAIVHDFTLLLEKFRRPRRAYRTLAFLQIDHIGGLNTLLSVLSSGGTLVSPDQRSPDAVGRAIEEHRVQLLPTSPTFLNLLLISEADRRWDLSSLELITYGTEVMAEETLRRLHAALPGVRLKQTYGLSEVGILGTKSRASDSLWMKVGGEGFETRVRDGMLEIRARSAMLGYLNAPSPLTEDGWLRTGDAAEVDGDHVRILGRCSELINVGGEKVYPAEVESALLALDGVEQVAVSGEPNAITGQLVCARVLLGGDESSAEFRRRMRRALKGKIERYKIPQKIVLVGDSLHNERFKTMRGYPP